MKKGILALVLIWGAFFVFGQNTGSIDLILLLDTSSGMSASYREVNEYITGGFLREFLRIGDTFHLIPFAGKPRVDFVRRVEGRGDMETLIGRMFLQYPLDPRSDISTALGFMEQYAASLPFRPKKIVLVSGGASPPPDAAGLNSLINDLKARLGPQGISFDYVSVAPGQSLANPPRSGRPALAAQSPGSAARPTGQAAQSPGPTAQSPGSAAQSSGQVVQPPGPAAQSPGSAARPTGQAAQSSGQAAQSSGPAAQTPGSVAQSSGQAAQSPGPTAQTPGSAAQSSGPTAQSPGSAAQSSGPAVQSPGPAGQSSGPTAQSPGSAAQSSGQAAQSPGPAVQSPGSAAARTGGARAEELPLFVIGIAALGLLAAGLVVFLVIRRLQGSPNRVMAKAASPRSAAGDDMQPFKDHSKDLASYAANKAKQRTTSYAGRAAAGTSPAPAVVFSDGPLLLTLVVEDQNNLIGKRNIHALKSGYRFTIGGGKSDFLIFIVPMPPAIGEVRRDGNRCTFIPRKAKYFPDIGSTEVPDCIGKTIRAISDKNYEIRFRLERYEDPLAALNRMLNSVKVPG